MIKIVKGGAERLVTAGAFNSIFKKQGWAKVEEPVKEVEPEDIDDFVDEDEDGIINEDDINEVDEDTEDEVNVDDIIGDDEDEDITEKPISEMNYKELVKFAEIKNIDIDGLKSKKEIKAAIKKALA